MKTGIELIAEERQRQISKKGWTSEHDDIHSERELARGSFAYLEHYVSRSWVFNNDLNMPGVTNGPKDYRNEPPPDSWPWDETFWKPKNPMRDLVKAGALIAAEIDRLQRKKKKCSPPTKSNT